MKQQTTNTTSTTENDMTATVVSGMSQDVRNSVLIVSLIANLFVLTAWIALQVTNQYDVQLANFLFNH